MKILRATLGESDQIVDNRENMSRKKYQKLDFKRSNISGIFLRLMIDKPEITKIMA
jgi:hypothetical protein